MASRALRLARLIIYRRRMASRAALLAAVLSAAAQAADRDGPVLSGTNQTAAQVRGEQLLVFRGTQLLNEFVYRAVVKLPEGAEPSHHPAPRVATQPATFRPEPASTPATFRP